MSFRTAILTVALLGAALVSVPALAQPAVFQTYQAAAAAAHPHDHSHGTYEVVGMPDGTVMCRPAADASLEQLQRTAASDLNLTLVSSTNNPATIDGMRIFLRATDQLIARPVALLAFRRAAALWERRITNPITVIIDVDFGPERFGSGTFPPGVIASATSALGTATIGGQAVGPNELRDALLAANGDAQLQQLYNTIAEPVSATTGSPLGSALMALPNRQALGFAPATLDPNPSVNPFGSVANIGFNSAFSYDFDPANGISSGFTDFEAIVAHEMGHSLGFNSAIGFGGPPNNFFTTWDLFRVRPDAVEPGDYDSFAAADRVLTPGPPPNRVLVVEGGTTYFEPEHVFFDGLVELATSTATGGREGGDGQQASHWQDDAQRPPSLGEDRRIGIMDPTFGGGRVLLEDADIRMLQVIGYNVDFDPVTTSATLSFDGTELDISTATPVVEIGDTPVGENGTAEFVFTNTGTEPLFFEAEVFSTFSVPVGVSSTLSVVESGEIAPGQQGSVAVTFGSDAPATFGGLLRLITNAQDRLVIDAPFEFTTGGAARPEASIDDDLLNFSTIFTDEPAVSQTVNISNEGGLPLEYEARMTLAAQASAARSSLSHFVGAERAAQAQNLFTANFEDDFNGFTASGGEAEDWRRVDIGPAALPGHSAPFAAYFGQTDPLGYRNNAEGLLLSPPIDLSGVPTSDLVTLTFSYYLQVVQNDIARVVLTYDDGATLVELATSDGGALVNGDEWQTMMIPLNDASGQASPLRIGFEFDSNITASDEGWFLDDIEVSALVGANPFYTAPRFGSIAGGTTEPLVVTIEPSLLVPARYRGNVQLVTNDFFQPEIDILVGFTLREPVSNENEAAPVQFALHSAYPNPFDQQTTLRFDLPETTEATLTVYDVLGREVARLLDGASLTAGSHTATLEASAFSAGAYLVRLSAGDDTATQRILLVR
ncbi:MAG: NF038122 family metalloprotease [Bacteroidota bacterium]